MVSSGRPRPMQRLGVTGIALLLTACASSAPPKDAALDAQRESTPRAEIIQQVGGGGGGM
jgi:hypothetical protein